MVRMIRWSCSQAFGWRSETLLALLGNGCFCLLCGFCRLQHMSKWSEPYGIILPYSPNLHRLLFSHGTCQGGHTRPKVDVGPAACFLCEQADSTEEMENVNLTYSSLLVDIWYMVTQCLLHRDVFFKKYFCPMVFHFIRETCFKFHSEGPCFGGPTSTAFTSNLKFRKLIDILWSFPCAVLERVWPLLY